MELLRLYLHLHILWQEQTLNITDYMLPIYHYCTSTTKMGGRGGGICLTDMLLTLYSFTLLIILSVFTKLRALTFCNYYFEWTEFVCRKIISLGILCLRFILTGYINGWVVKNTTQLSSESSIQNLILICIFTP